MTGGELKERKNQRGAGSGEPLLPGREAVQIGNLAFSIFGLALKSRATLKSYPPYILNIPSPATFCFLLAIFGAAGRNLPTIPISGPNLKVLLLTFPKPFPTLFS